MATTAKISELSTITDFTDTDYIMVVSGGTAYKMTAANFLQKAIRVDKADEISSADAKTVVIDADLILLEDSANGNAKKKATKAQFLVDVGQVSTGTDAPATTPSKIGNIFVDTAHTNVYIATGTSSSADWSQITLT